MESSSRKVVKDSSVSWKSDAVGFRDFLRDPAVDFLGEFGRHVGAPGPAFPWGATLIHLFIPTFP